MDHRAWPMIPADLLAHLETTFPERSARLGQPADALLFQGGQRDAVPTLRAVFELQNANVLSGHAPNPQETPDAAF